MNSTKTPEKPFSDASYTFSFGRFHCAVYLPTDSDPTRYYLYEKPIGGPATLSESDLEDLSSAITAAQNYASDYIDYLTYSTPEQRAWDARHE